MKPDDIVIVTQTIDPHVDDMIVALDEMGHEPIRLNTDDIPSNVVLSMALRTDAGQEAWSGGIVNQVNGRVIDLESIRSVWWRRPGPFQFPDDLSEQERLFASDEMDEALRGLWASLDCYWMSHPESIRQANWKTGQLQRAAALGFEVPRTLVTTDPAAARALYDSCDGQICYKVLTDPYLGAPKLAEKHPDRPPPEPRMTMTTLITEAELGILDSVRLVPCLFQEYVPKRVELRITVIGDELFVAELHSQVHEASRTDWRGRALDVPYRKAALPDEIAERCFALVRSYGLSYSALDLIVTPDDRYVFLENNPNGQFRFVEELVPELRMTPALAACLIRGANG